MTDRIIIPGRLVGLNEYTRACRSHWSRGARLKRQQTELVAWYARTAGAHGHEEPVEVTGIEHRFSLSPDWPRVVVEVGDATGGEGR